MLQLAPRSAGDGVQLSFRIVFMYQPRRGANLSLTYSHRLLYGARTNWCLCQQTNSV